MSSARNAKDGNAEDSPAPKKSNSAGNQGEPPVAAIPVPVPPKPVLPITLNTADAQSVDGAKPAETEPETINLQAPQPGTPVNQGELAFAAKIVDASNQAPQQPATLQPAPETTAAPLQIGKVPLPATTPVEQHVPPQKPVEPQQKPIENPHSITASSSEPQATASTNAAPPVHAITEAAATRDATASSIAPRMVEAPKESAPVEHAAPVTERPASTPVNEITLRISNADQSSTSIRMVDRSGELHVAVRATDSQVAETLRGGVEQLTAKLNNNGFSAEVWKPAAVNAAARTQSSPDQMSQQQQGTKDQPRDLSQRNQSNKQKYPDWMEEFYANNQ